jgi:hypothetical protein
VTHDGPTHDGPTQDGAAHDGAAHDGAARDGATSAAALPFPALLGARFAQLPPTVRALHLRRGAARYRGEITVERGTGWLSRLCARATRLPPAGGGGLTVEIDARPGIERWTRRFRGHAMPSTLWPRDGLLCERLGAVRFGFALDARDGVLTWTVARVHALGLPLPARWFAQVRAREFEHEGRYRFEVDTALPVVGRVVRYAGWLVAE